MISVIVPIFNAEPYLGQCLQSIIDQHYTDLEIICINDGSTDDSLNILKAFAVKDPRITIIDKENEGYGATCNRGISEAEGDYISIVEPDDWIEPRMYADMLAFAKGFQDPVDIIKTAYWRIRMPDTPYEQKLNCAYKNRIRPLRQPFLIGEAIHLLRHHPSIWSALYRRDFLNETPIRFNRIPGAGWADNPFLFETLCQAKSIIYLDSAYYCYREETQEKSSEFARRNMSVPFERWNDIKDVLERLDIQDVQINRALNVRGFTYMGGILEEIPLSTPGLEEAVRRMFSRMDADLVFGDPEISPAAKRLFADIRGLPLPKLHRFPYYKSLFGNGIYNLKNIGIKNTFVSLVGFFKRRKARTGQRHTD